MPNAIGICKAPRRSENNSQASTEEVMVSGGKMRLEDSMVVSKRKEPTLVVRWDSERASTGSRVSVGRSVLGRNFGRSIRVGLWRSCYSTIRPQKSVPGI